MKLSALQRRQIATFTLGWVAYASTYLLRKPLGVIKTDLETDFAFSKTQLGWFDTALLLPYACVQIFMGSLGDLIGARLTMSVALVVSGLSMLTFGSWSQFYIFFILFVANGTAQGLCWPNVCKILGSWYPDKSRNSIFGIFGTCAFAGGMIGTILAVHIQTNHGWRQVFWLPSLIVVGVGIVVYLLLHTPDEVGVIVPGKEQTAGLLGKEQPHSFTDLWRIPVVLEIAVAMFCLKLVRYCMYMWLPFYLLDYLHYTKPEAGWFSTVFEVGGVFGSALLGIMIDRMFNGQVLFGTTVSAACSTVSLLLFFWTGNWGLIPNCIFMGAAGAFNCGPDTILGGSLPAELGESDGRNAAAAVTGLVNGFGSIGACLEGPIIGFVSQYYGWTGMFYLMIGLSAVGTLASFRASVIQSQQERLRLAISSNIC